jgi:pyridoxal phosphate enzyme (YggS family)
VDERQADEIKERFGTVRENIKNASGGREVTLLAATKTVSAEAINYAIKEEGLRYIGENKVQELVEKYPYIEKDGVEIHFIGGLQTNKVRQIIDKVDMIQSLDSIRLAKEIDKRAASVGKVMRVLVEINIGREPDKGGIMPEETESFIREASGFRNIKIEGLMTMAPLCDDPAVWRQAFERLRNTRDELAAKYNIDLPVLSMGMTGDFKEAIAAGSTMLRIGTRLFGRRG